MTYNHAFSISFEVPNSSDEEGEDVTGEMIRAAILARLDKLDDEELREVVDAPYDTYEET